MKLKNSYPHISKFLLPLQQFSFLRIEFLLYIIPSANGTVSADDGTFRSSLDIPHYTYECVLVTSFFL
jgi:hypothetical protein